MDFLPGNVIHQTNWRGVLHMIISPFGEVIAIHADGAGYKGATPETLNKAAYKALRNLSRHLQNKTEKPLDNVPGS